MTPSTEVLLPPKVSWKPEERKFTDIPFAIIYILLTITFLAFGFSYIASAHPKYEVEDNTITGLGEHYVDSAISCCAEVGEKGYALYGSGGVCNYVQTGNRRHLASTSSSFPDDGKLFDAFLLHPEIPATLIAGTVAMAVLWVVLLRQFATPIVFFTEFLKVAVFIYIAARSPDAQTQVFFILAAIVYLAFIAWKYKGLIFAGKMISHSALALQKNPKMFSGLIGVKLLYVVQAYLFVTFFSRSWEVKDIELVVKQSCVTDESGVETCEAEADCEFITPGWVGLGNQIISFQWLWATMFFTQFRLTIVALTIGSWHFHPDDMPSPVACIKNGFSKSFGTISLSALILAIVEQIKRTINVRCWYHCGPQIVFTLPAALIGCALNCCCETCIKMLTKFTLIIHVFSGKSFFESAKSCYGVMTRHFEGGFITEYASKSVLQLGAYIFAFATTMSAWAWIDETYGWETIPQSGANSTDMFLFYMWLFYILFNLWCPVLAIYLIILIDTWLPASSQEYWVAPMAASFIGCISVLFFQYMAGVVLDTIDVSFVCWAIDRDNGRVDVKNDEYSLLIMELPGVNKPDSAAKTNMINANPEVSGFRPGQKQ